MLVRSFQLSDYAEVTLLMEHSLCESCYHEVREAFARQLSLDSGLVLVTEIDEKLAGVVIGTIDNNNEGYCYRIAVHPQYRRQGIGSAMVHLLQDRFQQRKVNRILVPIDTHNEKALPLYESLGYNIQNFTKALNKLKIVTGA